MFKRVSFACVLASALAATAGTFASAHPMQRPLGDPRAAKMSAGPGGLFANQRHGIKDGNPIERDQTTPTAFWYYYDATASQLSAAASANNARIVDLQVDQVTGSGPLFTASMVANTGTYAKGWWWYYGLSATDVSNLLSTNNARLISISPYQDGSNLHFAVVMIPNTGADAKGWWWVYGTSSYVTNTINSLPNPRVVELEQYSFNGSPGYAAVAISNTGTDGRAWWWYYNISPSGLASALNTNHAQLLSLVNDTSGFDTVMHGCPCSEYWYYYGLNSSQLGAQLDQDGARPTQLRTYFNGGSRTFDAVLVNNSNAITTRIGNLMRSVAQGWTGFYLKVVGANGQVLGALNDARAFEPASAMKIIIALYAMEQVQNGNLTLQTQVPVLDPNNYCNFAQTGTETVQNAITQMMENSDNARADMFLKRFGLATLTSFAHSIGMTHTIINDYVDCGPFTNHLTLDDATYMYDQLVQGHYITKANVQILFSMMAGKHYDFSGMYAGIQKIVTQEAAPYHLTSTQIASFENGIQLSQKSGGYSWPGGVPAFDGGTMYRTSGNDGFAQLPFCQGAKKAFKQYVFGFFYEEQQPGQPDGLVWNQMLAGAETLREQIRFGVSHWSLCGGP